MRLLNYITKRVLQMIPVFLIVTVIVFFMIRLIPGDPAEIMLGSKATPEALAAMREKMGLNQPMIAQFFIYLKELFHFDFGDSIRYNQSVSSLIATRFGVTFSLTLVSTIFTIIISFVLGYLAGIHKDKALDFIVRLCALVGLSAPTFWIGLLLLTAFAVNLKIFPVAGWGTTIAEHIQGLILPGLTQALGVSAVLIRNLRENVINNKDSDYVEFARGQGLRERVISTRYIIRNAMIPTSTLLSLKIAYMLGGSVVIESIFSLPGLGQLLVSSISSRDYAVVQGVVLTFVIIVMVINLATDILYSLFDPRVKLS